MKKNKNLKKSIYGLFIIYLIAVTWIILFKMELDISLLRNMNFRNINWIPFSEPLVVNGKVDVSEMILNTIVFIPFGIYLSMMKEKWNFIQKLLPMFGTSLLYEVMQYILAIGGSDITDLITNTLGGILGLGIYFLCFKLLGKNTIKVFYILAVTGTIFMVMLLGLLVIVNL